MLHADLPRNIIPYGRSHGESASHLQMKLDSHLPTQSSSYTITVPFRTFGKAMILYDVCYLTLFQHHRRETQNTATQAPHHTSHAHTMPQPNGLETLSTKGKKAKTAPKSNTSKHHVFVPRGNPSSSFYSQFPSFRSHPVCVPKQATTH